MNTSTNSDVFAGDLHGFIIYPTAWKKDEADAFTPISVIRQRHAAKYGHVLPGPLQFEVPQAHAGVMTSSSYQQSDPLLHEQAVAKLFDDPHREFLSMADDATKRRVKEHPDDSYTHLSGIGSWADTVEPSLATVFHRPIEPIHLQHIAAEIGSWARQHRILTFAPHPEGNEALLHMRVPTHFPAKQLTQPQIARISQQIHDKFNEHYENINGNKTYLMGGRTILPDPRAGLSDVLVWIDPYNFDPERSHHVFADIARQFRAVRTPLRWPGTGVLFGGPTPESDDEGQALTDAAARDAAVANYHKLLGQTQVIRDPKLDTLNVQPQLVQGTPFHVTRRGGRLVTLRDILGRFKNRLGRSNTSLKLHIYTHEDFKHAVTESARSFAEGGPHNDDPSIKYAGWLETHHMPGMAEAFHNMARYNINDVSPASGRRLHHVAGIHPSGHRVSITLNGAPDPGNITSNSNITPVNAHVVFSNNVSDQDESYQGYYRTTDMDHIRRLVDELHPMSVWSPSFMLSGTRGSLNHARALLGMPEYQAPQPAQFDRSPAGTGAVVRGVYYAPGKMMPTAVPIKPTKPIAPVTSVDAVHPPHPPESVLSRIRRKLKRRPMTMSRITPDMMKAQLGENLPHHQHDADSLMLADWLDEHDNPLGPVIREHVGREARSNYMFRPIHPDLYKSVWDGRLYSTDNESGTAYIAHHNTLPISVITYTPHSQSHYPVYSAVLPKELAEGIQQHLDQDKAHRAIATAAAGG